MLSYIIVATAVLLAVILDFWAVRTREHYKRLRSKYENEQKAYKETDLQAAAREETIKDLYLDKIRELYQQKIAPRLNLNIIVKLAILLVWAMVISKPYLNDVPAGIILSVIGILICLWVWRHRKKNDHKPVLKSVIVFGEKEAIMKSQPEPSLLHWLQENIGARLHSHTILELALLACIALLITQPYLDFNEKVIPAGNEFGSVIQNHHLWTRAQECGWCAIWNGSINGGYPAFVDLHGSALHPIVIITTLFWGVINGTKVALFLSFWLAGIAQWWLAKELKVSRLARLWTASLVIAGGHLSSRMELGTVGLIYSTAMASLVFAAVLYTIRKLNRKSVAVMGIILASSILSGQGYMQIGLAFMSPAILFLIWYKKSNIRLWKNFALSVLIAFLLAASLLVPLLHFSPQMTKWSDPEFEVAQPFKYSLLNLVIDNPDYYRNDTLQKSGYPYMDGHYIGWIPVVLAIIGIVKINNDNRQYVLFLSTGVVLVFLTSSAISLKWVENFYPGIAGVRHPPIISGLAIPLLLGLSAYGLDAVRNGKWPKVFLDINQETPAQPVDVDIPVKWLIILPLILIAFYQAREFSKHWIYTTKMETGLYEMIDALQTPSLEWVNPPFGEHRYAEPAIANGLKLSPGFMAWSWVEREPPAPRLEALLGGPPVDEVVVAKIIDEVPIYLREYEHYAAIQNQDEIFPCVATGNGGSITVSCNSPVAGILTIKENYWNGWYAWQDGQSIKLLDNQYLQVHASEGEHTYKFNYLPWDVPLGIILSLTGVIVFLIMFFAPEKTSAKSPP